MKITDPVLVPDVSIWCDHINPQEFVDGGCASVVVGLYASFDNSGKKILSPISLQQCTDVATKSSMVLQAYFWDDITQDPVQQADWVATIIQSEGLPIKWVWADQEQWWTDWTAWQQGRNGTIPMASVPAGTPAAISAHYQKFIEELHSKFPQSGVYTNNGFVSSWAPGMNNWLPNYRSWVPQYGNQPKEATQMTWAQLAANWMPNYDLILASGQLPQMVMGHQFTGDSCILPGSYSKDNIQLPLDVSVFSKAFIDAIKADTLNPVSGTPTPTPVTPTPYVVIYTRINVRALPDGNSTWVRYAVQGEVLQVVNISNGWAQLADGTYVYAAYINPQTTTTPVTPTPTPTPTPVPPSTVDYIVIYPRINVRAQPDGNSTWVRYAVQNEVLQVVNISNGWAELLDGTYVFAAYIAIKTSTTPVTPPPTPIPTTVAYVVIYARINVRAKPDSSSTWVRFAVKGEVLQVVSITNGWAQLADGTYVYADYIQKQS
ncbi:MAG TPA: SH3 domain-containing protein [Anaerolineales bacterium]|nr:SH3 domain-containing protein [Anaerolineales bacterium]